MHDPKHTNQPDDPQSASPNAASDGIDASTRTARLMSEIAERLRPVCAGWEEERFQSLVRRIAELAVTEPDSRRFLELSVEELARLPWIRGGRWRSPDGEAVFGEPEGAASPFSHESLEMVLYTRHALSPALALHIRLLARVIGQFYEAKRREMALRHSAYLQATHDFAVVKRLLQEELQDIVSRRPKDAGTQDRYRKATKIALRWIKNYTDLDFRSLGSYTRADLDRIAGEPDAF